MGNSKAFAVALLVALSSATAVCAQEDPLPKASDTLVKYGEVEGWTVYANKTRGDCLIVNSFGPGAVQMGVAADRSVGYLGVFTKLDIGVKNGVKEIFVDIDGNLYSGLATTTAGQLKDGYSGGYILADDPDFKRDVAKKYTMIVFPETQGAFVVDLKGTYKAMAMGHKCLTEQKAG
jgi:hypothetical protein